MVTFLLPPLLVLLIFHIREGDSCSSYTPVDCKWVPSSDWSPCSATCGPATRTRTLHGILPQHGGLGCWDDYGNTIRYKTEEVACSVRACDGPQPPPKKCEETQCVSACPVNWVEKDNHCYLWSRGADAKKSWDDAEQFCKSEAGHLVSVTSKIVNDYLVEEKKRKGITSIWIGGSDKEEEGVWKWLDCSSFRDHRFTAWAHHQPSNGKDQHCLELWSRKWNDNLCSKKNNFVCSKRLCPSP